MSNSLCIDLVLVGYVSSSCIMYWHVMCMSVVGKCDGRGISKQVSECVAADLVIGI